MLFVICRMVVRCIDHVLLYHKLQANLQANEITYCVHREIENYNSTGGDFISCLGMSLCSGLATSKASNSSLVLSGKLSLNWYQLTIFI